MTIRVNQESVLSTASSTNALAGGIDASGGQAGQVADQLNGQVSDALTTAVSQIEQLAQEVRQDALRIVQEHQAADWQAATKASVEAAVEQCNRGVDQTLARADGDQQQVRQAVVQTLTDWVARVRAELQANLSQANQAIQAVNATSTGFANDAVDLDRTYASRLG